MKIEDDKKYIKKCFCVKKISPDFDHDLRTFTSFKNNIIWDIMIHVT